MNYYERKRHLSYRLHYVNFLQYVTEKMGGAEGTKLDLDFVEMERVSNRIYFDKDICFANEVPWTITLYLAEIECRLYDTYKNTYVKSCS